MKSTKFTIGLVQMRCGLDPRENLDKAVERVAEAAKQGAQIVCLQELFRSQYTMRVTKTIAAEAKTAYFET